MIVNSLSEFHTSCDTTIVTNTFGFQGNTLLFMSNGTFIAEGFRFKTDKQYHFANVTKNSHLSLSDALVLVGSSIQSILEIDESTVILTSVRMMSNTAHLPQISSYSPNGGTLSIIASTISSLISSTQNQLLPHPNLTTTTLVNSVVSNITSQDISYSPEGLIDCLSSSPQPRIGFVEDRLTPEETAQYFPFFTVNKLILANDGVDELYCGYDYKAKGDCKTITYAVQNLKADKSDPFYYLSIRNTVGRF
ncbi:hypothetical protein BLNAU_11026 [Blattamonas nauphoetae]|uniref:Uncharacterized protein n=1 Tax=Blattamonas nauphoetae TaxID=2049346 RepID=A0ABQ9XRH4_9EUKA|nr:hypothetical protein BLNAU_11026 [Blattamonas nauphoetae]